jgi:hypothetical protein
MIILGEGYTVHIGALVKWISVPFAAADIFSAATNTMLPPPNVVAVLPSIASRQVNSARVSPRRGYVGADSVPLALVPRNAEL